MAIVKAMRLNKAAMDDYSARVEAALDAFDWDWRDLLPKVEPYLVGVAVAAGGDAINELGLFDESVTELMTRDAVAYAKDRAAEMVGMTRHGQLTLPNPNAEWTIADATRDMLRSTIETAFKESWTVPEIRTAIKESTGFSAGRAQLIARTEVSAAYVQGNLAGWKASGLVAGKQWDADPDCCDECQEYDGLVVAIDDEFPEGDPPLHPNCRCALTSVLNDELPDHGDDENED